MLMRKLYPFLFCFVSFGCDHAPPVDWSGEVDLLTARAEEPMAPRMRGILLKTHKDYDRLESTFKDWSQEGSVLSAYDQLLATHGDNVLLATRAAQLRLRLGGLTQVPKVIPVAERLRKSHPESPDVKHLLASSAFLLLPRGPVEGSFALRVQGTSDQRAPGFIDGAGDPTSVAKTALRLWNELLENTPNYVGPHGIDSVALKLRTEALTIALRKEAIQKSGIGPGTKVPVFKESDAVRASRVRVVDALQRQGSDEDVCSAGEALLEDGESSELQQKVKASCERVAAEDMH